MAMQSDHHHIDDFFRQKADDYVPDTSNLATHRQQLSATLDRQQLRQFYDQLEKEPQEFIITGNQSNVITAREGTCLTLPENSFSNKAGIVTGAITIQILEYYRYSDIIAARLNTRCNRRQLVTGGMIHIKAMADGEELMITPRRSISLSMPAHAYDERMMLFCSELPTENITSRRKSATSTAVTTAGPLSDEKTSINWIMYGQVQKRQVNSHIPVFGRGVIRLSSVQAMHGETTTGVYELEHDIDLSDNEIKQKLQERLGDYFDKIQLNRIDATHIRLYSSAKWSSEKTYFRQAVLAKALELLFGKTQLLYRKPENPANEPTTTGDQYNFKLIRIGWINCDRYMEAPDSLSVLPTNVNKEKITVTIHLDKETEAMPVFAQLVFLNSQSIIYGSYEGNTIRFDRVLSDEPMQLICVGIRDGQALACIQPIVASIQPINNLQFTPITPSQFKQQLEVLFPADQPDSEAGTSGNAFV